MTRTLLVLPWLLLVVSLTLAADEKKDEDKPTVKLSDDEKMILELANKERGKNKTPALKLNKILCEVARKHNENMAKKNKVAHLLDGKNPAQRVTAAGYRYASVGENLAWIEGDEDCKPPTPARIHKLWMDSKTHKANIVAGKFTEIGISKYKGSKGDYYYTQVFARPARK